MAVWDIIDIRNNSEEFITCIFVIAQVAAEIKGTTQGRCIDARPRTTNLSRVGRRFLRCSRHSLLTIRWLFQKDESWQLESGSRTRTHWCSKTVSKGRFEHIVHLARCVRSKSIPVPSAAANHQARTDEASLTSVSPPSPAYVCSI